MSVSNSFASLHGFQNRFTRKFGTTNSAVEPFISGYFFIHFSYLPKQLANNVSHAAGPDGIGKGDDGLKSIASTLHSTCLSVTIPGGTVNTTDIVGLGGVKWAVPTNVEWDNTVTLRFLELSSLPIHAIFHGWTRMIRDYRSGVTPLDSGGKKDGDGAYIKTEYAATMYYWVTKPDGHLVEYASCMSGMFPKKDPTDLLSSDITTNDKLEIDIDFNCDYLWHEDWVLSNAQDLSDIFYGKAWNGVTDGGEIGKVYGEAESGDYAPYTS